MCYCFCWFSDKIVTGSFDKTCKLWSAETGQCYHTLRGHTSEVVHASFNPQSTLIVSGSMDMTARLWDVEHGTEKAILSVIAIVYYKYTINILVNPSVGRVLLLHISLNIIMDFSIFSFEKYANGRLTCKPSLCVPLRLLNNFILEKDRKNNGVSW